MKAVHFGAGNIGRGFIGELLHDSGYEITFVEVDQKVVDAINKDHAYHMYIIDDNYKQKTIDKVRAFSPINQEEEIIKAIEEADLITTSVCVDNFSKIAGTLAKGLKARLEAHRSRVDVLACENAFYASDMLKKVLETKMPEAELDEVAAFPNVAVDRIALAREEDGIKVPEIQKTFELIIEKNKLAHGAETIKGAEYVEDLNMYLERKLYVFNCGHAATAYLGYNRGCKTIFDSLKHKDIHETVKGAMLEAGRALTKKYSFTMEDMEKYIAKILSRISLEALHDEVIRVGRSPIRKLGKHDRLVGPMELALSYGLPIANLIKAIAAGYAFDEATDEQAQEIQKYIILNGLEKAVEKYSEIDDIELVQKIVKAYEEL